MRRQQSCWRMQHRVSFSLFFPLCSSILKPNLHVRRRICWVLRLNSNEQKTYNCQAKWMKQRKSDSLLNSPTTLLPFHSWLLLMPSFPPGCCLLLSCLIFQQEFRGIPDGIFEEFCWPLFKFWLKELKWRTQVF